MQKLGLQSININLSPLQCLHSSIAEDLLETAHRYHIDMRMVNFEITESSMMDIDLFHNVMQRLINAGSFFSLDDYGTGFSNLINVLSLPFHTVKIDKSIAWAYFQGNDQVLPEIIRMFLNRNLQILVEGVETQEMAQKLIEMQCQLEQGYYFSRPIPEQSFLEISEGFLLNTNMYMARLPIFTLISFASSRCTHLVLSVAQALISSKMNLPAEGQSFCIMGSNHQWFVSLPRPDKSNCLVSRLRIESRKGFIHHENI